MAVLNEMVSEGVLVLVSDVDIITYTKKETK